MLFVVIKVQMHAFVMGRSKLQTLNRFIALYQLDVHVWWIIAERLCSRNKRLTRTEPVSVPHAFHDTQIQTVPVCFWLTHGGGDSSISVSATEILEFQWQPHAAHFPHMTIRSMVIHLRHSCVFLAFVDVCRCAAKVSAHKSLSEFSFELFKILAVYADFM